MANSDYIKEFLIKLGYQVSDSEQKKFEEALGKSEKSTDGLAKNLKKVAVALGTVSSVAAYRLNALYINAQRAGTSASKLDALRQAVSNVGGDANAAAQSVASIAQKLRDVKNFDKAFSRFGVEAKDANGQIRDTVDLLNELVNSSKFRGLSYEQQSAYMRDLFGIDDLTFRTIRSGEFAKEYQKILDIQAKFGNETDKSAKSVRDFMVGINELQAKGGAALDVLVGNLAEKLAPALRAVNDAANDMMDWYSRLSPESKELAKDIGSVAVAVGMVAASMKALSLLKGLGGLLTGGAAGSGGAAGGAAGAAAKASLLSNPAGWIAGLGLGSFAADAYMTMQDADSVMSRETGGDLVGALYNSSIDPASHRETPPGIFPAAHAQTPQGSEDRLSARDIMAFFMGKGLTKEQAAGIAANLSAESSLNHRAVGDNGKAYGYAQWREDKAAGARQQLFEKWFGKNIKESTPREQLEFIWKELQTTEKRALSRLRQARSAMQAGAVFSREYERPAEKEAQAYKRGSLAEQYNQSINITVNGAKYPEQSAEAVKEVMERRDGVMTRNFKTQLR